MQVPGPFAPGVVPISGFAMLQHQIKAVHDSAHQEEKHRQDQGDLERRPPFNSRSPTIIDRDGTRTKSAVNLSFVARLSLRELKSYPKGF